MDGLLIKSPHIENILSGRKCWEIRGQKTSKLNRRIALIRSGSALVVGTCKIVAIHGPLTRSEMERTEQKHLVERSRFGEVLARYPNCYGWELQQVVALRVPVSY